MGIWNSFKYKDVVRKIEKLWCKKLESKKGSHEIRININTNLEFVVVNHWAKEMRIGTLKAMLRGAWINEKDFLDT